MICLKKVKYTYLDKPSRTVGLSGMTVLNKAQLEKLRDKFAKANKCENVTFTYEEH